jgi:hypothetical protein
VIKSVRSFKEFLLSTIVVYVVLLSPCNERLIMCKDEAVPELAWRGPEDSKNLRLSGFLDNRHMKVARLSALHTGRLYSPGDVLWYSFLLEAESTLGP